MTAAAAEQRARGIPVNAMKVSSMTGFGRSLCFAGVMLVVSACSGPQHPANTGPRPLCEVSTRPADAGVHRDAGTTMAVRSLRPEQWFALLLRGYDRSTGQIAQPAQDCTGSSVRWPSPPSSCAETAAEGERLPERALTEDDLVIQRASGNNRIVWALVDRYSNGEAVGPVALAEFTNDGVAVRTLGTLRAMPKRARLRIEDLGTGRVLVAEGEYCTDDHNPGTCHRSVRLLPIVGDHFAAEPLTRADAGTCVGPARFDLAREETVILDTGWARRFELNTSLTFGTQVTVHEQVVVKDSDPRLPAIPSQVFRRVDADRTVRVEGGHLVVDEPSLWSRVAQAQASVGGHRSSDDADAGAVSATASSPH